MPIPPERGVAPVASRAIRLRFTADLSNGSFGAYVSVPMSLRELITRLPPDAQAVLGWLPNIVLEAVGISFVPDPATQSFGVYAEAGIIGAAEGSADAFAVTLPDKPRGVRLVAGLRLSSTVDLAATPLFGSMLSGLAIQDLQVAFASADIPAGQVVLPYPAHGRSPAYAKGLQLAFLIVAGDAQEWFVLTPSQRRKPRALAAGDGEDAPPVRWFPVQKSFGPLTLGRVGVLTSSTRMGLALDASVATKALSIDLTGFIVSFDINDISPSGVRVDLDGLGVAFRSGSVSLIGSLVGSGPASNRTYDGTLMLQVGKFGVTAVGSYSTIGGSPSLFVFGLVMGHFGGPPAFFVTGLAAGFGYNRGLRLPEPSQVQTFPLVLAARLGNSYLPDPSVKTALGKLSSGGWVPPELGSYWVAVGVKFTSFQIIDSFVLLSVQFGNELVIAILGISSLQLPKAGWGKPYAYVELVLSAVIRPAAGTVQVMALLTPNSFVIDKACRLSGGFAFYLWFGETHRGDFVVTIGGYNDYYVKPKHYPVVPRLGFNWTVSPELRVSGAAYFALTPSCVMGGGRLDAAYESGALRAWFRAYADFLMYWRPFYFVVGIGVVIGASYTLTIGSLRKTFTVELGAEVELWGPPLAGIARISWWVISFTIAINGGGRPNLPGEVLADWEEFATSFLPPRAEICKPRADAGLTAMVPQDQRPDAPQIWLVSALDLVLAAETVIPASELVAGAAGTPQVRFPGTKPGVYPLGSLMMTTPYRLELWRHPDGQPVDLSRWSWAPQSSGLPESLWGTVNDGEANPDAPLVHGFIGLRGAPPAPAKTGPPPMLVKVLGQVAIQEGDLPLPADDPVNGSTDPPSTDPRIVIADTIASPEIQLAREETVAALNELGLGSRLVAGEMSVLASQVRRTFPEPPMLGPPGTTGPRPSPVRPVGLAGQSGTARSRPALPGQAGGAPAGPAPSGAVPSLAAVFRRAGNFASVHVFDRYATSSDRAVLAGLPGRTVRLRAGTSLVWELPPGAVRLAEVPADPGGLPVVLAGFDRQYRLAAWVTLDSGASYSVPEEVTRLVAGCPATGVVAVGWSAGTVLLQAGPQALLAPGAVIRPQAPARIRCGRNSRPVGRIDAAAMVSRNWVALADGRQRGWIITTLPAGVRSATVIMAPDDPGAAGSGAAGSGAVVSGAADAWLLGADGKVSLGLTPDQPGQAASAGGPVVRLRCELPESSGTDEPVGILVAPRPGWYQHGLVAGQDAASPATASAGGSGFAQVRLS